MKQISEFIAPDAVIVDVTAADKEDLLQKLSRKASQRLSIPSDEILKALLNREELGSTGMGGGVALPHARMAELEQPIALFARLRRPINFDAVDSEPVDLVCLVLLPAAKGDQLNTLACVARSLRDPVRVQRIRDATGSRAVYDALVTEQPPTSKPFSTI